MWWNGCESRQPAARAGHDPPARHARNSIRLADRLERFSMLDGQFRSRVVISLGIILAPIIAVAAPWALVRGGDAPNPNPNPSPAVLSPSRDEPHRSPIALALSGDGARL